MSQDPLLIIALLLVLVVFAVIAGICVAAAVRAKTMGDRGLFAMLACGTMVAFAIVIALLRWKTS